MKRTTNLKVIATLMIITLIVILMATIMVTANKEKTSPTFTNDDDGKTKVIKLGETFNVEITAPPNWVWGMGGPWIDYIGDEYVTNLGGGQLSDKVLKISYTAQTPGTFVIKSATRYGEFFSLRVKIVPAKLHES